MVEQINYKMQEMSEKKDIPLSQSDMENLTFRHAMNRLNTVVSQLESNTLELEESLEKYKEGVALLANLKSRLNNAQQQVEILMGQLDENTLSDEESDKTLS